MPALKLKKPSKKQFQAICGGILILLVLILLVFFYPLLQLQLAEQLMDTGKYSQAEPILAALIANDSLRQRAGYKLVACQLFLGKGREAAQTVISLTGAQEVDDLELAIIFSDVATYLVNSGNGEAALELAKRVRNHSDGEMLTVAVKEIGFLIAKRSDLPLALDAINLALAQSDNNWRANLQAFNLLLTKSLESPALLGEPALDRALELYPGNIIAVTRKASILGDKVGPQAALDFLLNKEPEIEESITPEYLAIKRTLLLRLAATDTKAELSLYTNKMPFEMIVEIAQQGLNHASTHTASGRQYYNLAPNVPKVAYQFGRNLFQMGEWEESRKIFSHLEKLDPKYTDFRAIYAALNSKTRTKTELIASDEIMDAIQISPDGHWLAWRKWYEVPQEEIMVSSLILTDLDSGRNSRLGDVSMFKWSPNSKYLAYQVITTAGLGRLHIFSPVDGSTHTLPTDYDIIDFNWAGEDLMVQALVQRKTILLHLKATDWEVVAEKTWKLNTNINSDYSWLTVEGSSLVVYRELNKVKTFHFDNPLMLISEWSPNGNLAVIADIAGKSWIYDHRQKKLTPIPNQGQFIGWGQDQEIFWFLPLWQKLHILVRLDNKGAVKEYYPYSFTDLYADISVSATGKILTYQEDENIWIMKR